MFKWLTKWFVGIPDSKNPYYMDPPGLDNPEIQILFDECRKHFEKVVKDFWPNELTRRGFGYANTPLNNHWQWFKSGFCKGILTYKNMRDRNDI